MGNTRQLKWGGGNIRPAITLTHGRILLYAQDKRALYPLTKQKSLKNRRNDTVRNTSNITL